MVEIGRGKIRNPLIKSLLQITLFILTACSTGLDTQMNAVLDKVEEDLGYVNTIDAANVAKMASWFEKRGDDSQKARALYCLGRTQFNERSYSASIISYTRALEYAVKSGDYQREGLICRDIARVNGMSGNSSDEILFLARASEAFGKAGSRGERQSALLEIGQAQTALGKFDTAEEIFKSVLFDSHEMRDTLLEARCLEAYASLAVSEDEPDPSLAIDLLSRAANDLRYPLTPTDKGILAYSYSLMGDKNEALKWLSEAKASVETDEDAADIDFREYQIASRSGDPAKALKALERVTEYGNKAQLASLEEAVSASQREYLQGQSEIQAEKLRAARMRLWLLALVALLAVGSLIVAYLYYRSEQQRLLEAEIAERDRYMSIAEDLRDKLAIQSAPEPVEGPGFQALERLCEQYYIYEGTDNLQPRILKEVKSIVEGLRSDKKVRKSMEDMLDKRKNGVMTKLRSEFPSWKEEDFQIYAFTAAGFSSTTISALMEKEKSVIYNRVWRLKGRISNSASDEKDFFLACLDN
ncbi:MAG: hypothetical protein IKW99_00600 [Bacteroidales bacterium]|nr:hypothetical protein [Bacteroidales bacterium]